MMKSHNITSRTSRFVVSAATAFGLVLASSLSAWADDHKITEEMVTKAQETWAEGVVAIGAAENPKEVAEKHVDELYAYDEGEVLFKPTKAAEDQFRLTEESAVSYFVGGNEEFPEDKGFALQPWTNVEFENADIIIDSDSALAMGNYYFTTTEGDKVKVEYSFGYVLNEEGDDLLINLHHSSLPFTAPEE